MRGRATPFLSFLNRGRWRTACVAGLVFAAGCQTVPPPPDALDPVTLLAGTEARVFSVSPDNGELSFGVSIVGLGAGTGVFEEFEATLTITDPATATGDLVASVEVGTLVMDNPSYQDFVGGPEWFDAENHPQALLSGALTGWEADSAVGSVEGTLTINGFEQPATFEVRLTCDEVTMCPQQQVGLDVRAELDRTEFGMTSLRGFVGGTVRLVVTGTLPTNGAADQTSLAAFR